MSQQCATVISARSFQEIPNLRKQHLFLRRSRRWAGRGGLFKAVHLLDHQKNYEGQNRKVKEGLQKDPVVDGGRSRGFRSRE